MKLKTSYLTPLAFLAILGCSTVDNSPTGNKASSVDKVVENSKSSKPESNNVVKKSPAELFTYYPSDSQLMAIVYGRFVLKDNCLLIEPVGQEKLITPVFPKGKVEFLVDRNVVVLNGSEIPLGKQFGTGGGALPSRNVTYATKGDSTCLLDTVFISDGVITAIE